VSPPSDHATVQLALAGDADAFQRLYREHAAMVHALARRLLGAGQADDLTQDVFVRAWQKLATFRGDAPFGAWLRTLAVRLLANAWRQQTHAADYDAARALARTCPHLALGGTIELRRIFETD
jgi:RNA polymerase sigma-70 factor (ECF subfamily)